MKKEKWPEPLQQSYIVVLAHADKKTVGIYEAKAKPGPVISLPHAFRQAQIFVVAKLGTGDYERRMKALKHLPVDWQTGAEIFKATNDKKPIIFFDEVPFITSATRFHKIA